MNVSIEISYKAASSITQKSSFPLRGRKPEAVALNWWKQIKNEMSYHVMLEKVVANGDKDITQLVKELEEQERIKALRDDLPF